MNYTDLRLLLKEPFAFLREYGASSEALRKGGKKILEEFDTSIKQLSIHELRDLLLILEGEDREGLPLLPHARLYANEVLVPRLAANIVFKIIYQLGKEQHGISAIVILGQEIITPRITWSFEESIRNNLFKALLRVMYDPQLHCSPADVQGISAFIRKIALTSGSECGQILLEIEQLIHLKRLTPKVIDLVDKVPKHNGVLVVEE
jgi:hypothetical protein